MIFVNGTKRTLVVTLAKKIIVLSIITVWLFSLFPGMGTVLDLQNYLNATYRGSLADKQKMVDNANASIELYKVVNDYLNSLK